MCGVFGSIGLELKTLESPSSLFPANGDHSKRFKNINGGIISKLSSEQFRPRGTSTFSAIGSLHTRQTGTRSVYFEERQGPLKNAATSCHHHFGKNRKHHLMNLQPIQYASAPARSKTSLPSGAPAEHITSVRC